MSKTENRSTIRLPKCLHAIAEMDAAKSRRVTIIGANGAGKSRFMDEMIELCGDKAYCLDVLTAFFPESNESTLPGSIDVLYREAMRQIPYLRSDAVSQLDKLFYMLLADEMQNLMEIKATLLQHGAKARLPLSKFDLVRRNWETIFPDNRIVRHGNRLMFGTGAGDDLITLGSLSQGEKAVLYYLAGVLFAAPEATVFIDSPGLFLHPAIRQTLWDAVEQLRPDCTFIYNSVDVDFVTSRTSNTCLWVKSYDSRQHAWDYDLLKSTPLSEELMIELAGSRKPVLFIEGDDSHSIDQKLYSLVFRNRTVRALGSCNKVIETVRAFNDLSSMHHLQSMGIVDRDRRTDSEVEYLRKKNILVPDVAEIENIFLLPEVVRVMARRRGKDARRITDRMHRDIVRTFKAHADEQALQHTRHKIKRDVECRIDAKFTCITAMETHLKQLVYQLEPRRHFNRLRDQFHKLAAAGDLYGILRVFNHKPMLAASNVHTMLGYPSPQHYISGVLETLKGNDDDAGNLRNAIAHILEADEIVDNVKR